MANANCVSTEYNHTINITLNGFGGKTGVYFSRLKNTPVLVKYQPVLSPKPFNKM